MKLIHYITRNYFLTPPSFSTCLSILKYFSKARYEHLTRSQCSVQKYEQNKRRIPDTDYEQSNIIRSCGD